MLEAIKLILELLISIVLGTFVYLSHGWALGLSVACILIMAITIQNMCSKIIDRLDIIYNKV